MQEPAQRQISIELCLRSSAPSVARGRQEEIRERAESLADDGRVADISTQFWSTRVCAPGGGAADRCPRVVGEIFAAAAEADLTIEPYFRRRPASFDDEEVIFLPVICLLVRRDGDIHGIYPATEDCKGHTVMDAIEMLEDQRPIENC